MKIIYKSWGSDPVENPKGYPAGYPRDSREVDDKTTPPEGWFETTREEYRILISSFYNEVALINEQVERTAKDLDNTKLDALKQLFADGKVIRDGWAGLSNGQKLELVPIVFDLLFKQRRQILEQYRPE